MNVWQSAGGSVLHCTTICPTVNIAAVRRSSEGGFAPPATPCPLMKRRKLHLKANVISVCDILDSNAVKGSLCHALIADTIGAFNTGFETVNVHRPTLTYAPCM
jgi:hypothetical protein